jgi:uncharacterized protein
VPSSSRSIVTTKKNRSQGKRTLAVWGWVVGLCLAVLIATYMIFVEPPPPYKIVIASGGQKGAYFHFAQKYAQDLQELGLSVEVRETAGSVENLRLLEQQSSGVSVAIVQSGLANAEELQRFYALGSLYREPLWIFYRADKPLERISQFSGKRLGIGPPGSGTNSIAIQLLAANGLRESAPSKENSRVELVRESVADSAKALQRGALDGAFFVAAFDADYIQALLGDDHVRLLHFDEQEAYHRRFRFLSPITIPKGLVDLGRNIPAQDVALVAPTAMLVVRKDLHPALIPLLLTTATRIHGRGDVVSDPGEFPSASYCDFPVSEDARHFYRSGPPVLQRLLPFWLASLIDRVKVMLIPMVMLMMPLLRATPPLMRWRTRRKIYRWYSDLRDIDQTLTHNLSGPELDVELARRKDIERQVAYVNVPLSYMEEFYHLRLHLGMLQQHLIELRTPGESTITAAKP